MSSNIQLIRRMNSNIATRASNNFPTFKRNRVDNIRMMTCHDYLYILKRVHHQVGQLVYTINPQTIFKFINQEDIPIIS
mgnify:CR=1 FL=1